jgi:hypothetical protein
MPLQVRRGPTADRILITPADGELILDTTEKSLYVGDGVTPGGVAATSFTFEDAQDAAADLFITGVHQNIAFTYNDQAGRIDASLNLRNYDGVIEADAFQGSVYSDNSTLLLDGVLAAVNLDGTVRSDIIPAVDEAFDIGSPTSKFKDLYLSGSSLWIGNAQITATNSSINLPAGSTVDGVSIGSGNGTGDGVVEGSNYRINVIGEDSSLIVDSSTGSVTAPGGITGDLTGSVFGNDNALIVDAGNNSINVSGGITGDLIGSVFGQDSTMLVDATNSQIRGDFVGKLGDNLNTNNFAIVNNDNIFIIPTNFTQFGSTVFGVNGNIVIRRTSYTGGVLDGKGGFLFEQFHNNTLSDKMVFHKSRGTPVSPLALQTNDHIAEISFVGNTNVAPFSQTSAAIRVVADSGPVGNTIPARIEFRTNAGSSLDRVAVITSDKKMLVNTIEGLTTGLTVVGDLTGSVFTDNSTRIIDGTDGSITAGSFVQFGSLTATDRNALTAVNGMVIYNTTYNRFEGYQNGAWINLDDGTAAGI